MAGASLSTTALFDCDQPDELQDLDLVLHVARAKPTEGSVQLSEAKGVKSSFTFTDCAIAFDDLRSRF